LSCGNFRALESILQIEQMLGKPLIASNSAALWSALNAAGWQGSVPNAGVLLNDVGRRGTKATARA
jgi:maleate isomerase